MTIRRLAPEARLAGATVHGNTVYLAGQVADDSSLDAEGQMADILRQIDALLAGTAPETPQEEALATTFTGRRPEDGRIDWRQTSGAIFNLIRAVTDPYPGAFTDLGPARLMVWWAEPAPRPPGTAAAAPGTVLAADPLLVATGDGALLLTRTEWRGAPVPALAAGRQL